MPFSYRQLFLGGTTFCCCLPVRMGVISMSILGCLVAGLLTVILWFELESTTDLTSQERAAFVIAALTETILFAASIFGLVGAIVRKQSFTQIYAYILYVHFIINLGVAAYLTYEVTRVTTKFENLACQAAIKDPQAQGQCTGFLTFARWVYLAIASTVLLVELYGAIIVTRYLNQLKREKGSAQAMRMDTENAFQLKVRNGHQYSKLDESTNQHFPGYLPPLDSYHLESSDVEFDPYTETVLPSTNGALGGDRHALPIAVGYGGGSWTHDDIVTEEKGRSKDIDEESVAAEAKYSPNLPPYEESRFIGSGRLSS
ncbi:hypothetical protein GALMADRAFT_248557 [Galerina marginata CBS 339.88]|uniref:Uncharacterized protein n=1 Tax=Galerina marginata (strain CBS 339.88) TaxID=685588 RepID=A0A067T0I2_GALM3|nr:hypothetical protein GALMADRAFT_248557 [Galerina marginata CBS 339.88]